MDETIISFFGSDVYATSITLGTFMGGLSIGSFLSGYVADNLKKPILIYGILEIFIAISAILFPIIIFGMNDSMVHVYQKYFFENGYIYQIFRLLISILTLLIPTILMGATLPLLIREFTEKKIELGERVGFLYSINTLGALTGTVLAGFILIQMIGIKQTTILMVILNIIIGLIAIYFSYSKKEEFIIKKNNFSEDFSLEGRINLKYILYSTFFTGMAGLALEVVWTRILVKSFSGTTHSFSVMLACFLFGIFYGSKKISTKLSTNDGVVLILLKLQLWLAGTVALLAPITYIAPNIFGNLTWSLNSLTGGNFGLASVISQFFVGALLILLPTTLLGASFPVAVKVYINNFDFRAKGTGNVYAFNTLGAVIGSILGGFVLLPFFGTRFSLIFISVLFFISAMFLIKIVKTIDSKEQSSRFHKFLSSGIFIISLISIFILPQKTIINYNMQKNSSPEVLYHNDGMSHTIDIVRSEDKNIIMMVNGNIEADTTFVQKRHFVLKAHLPLLLRGDSNEVAVVGLGLGITLKSLLKNPLSKKVELIELSPDMIKAHRMNPEISDNVLENSKLKIVIDDARNYMNMSKKKFDIITADPIHPRITGVGYLYTKEYYEILEERLKKNGIVLQWMPMYRISKDSFDVALRTFVEVYPNSTFWYVRGHGLLVGSKQEKKINFSDLVSRFNSEEIKNDLKSIGINSPHELLGHMIMDKDKISQYLMSKEKD